MKQIRGTDLVVDYAVRKLCAAPYTNHRKGCPNFGKRLDCPPHAKRIEHVIDLTRDVFVIWNKFNFGKHCQRMRSKHPEWSQRQVECCLYWQGTARKQLRYKIIEFKREHSGMTIVKNPEGAGVNVTATMEKVGIILQWPPVDTTYQIVLAGY